MARLVADGLPAAVMEVKARVMAVANAWLAAQNIDVGDDGEAVPLRTPCLAVPCHKPSCKSLTNTTKCRS